MTTTEVVGGPPVAPSTRRTKQQRALWEALGTGSGFRSAAQVHAEVSATMPVSLATVYRALATLVDEGSVDVIHDQGTALYRRCLTTDHHHHLTCRNCYRTVEIDAATVETWASALGTDHGFREVSHLVELFGVCENCTA